MTGAEELKLDTITDKEKRLILWAEIGALLHDVGKLSNVFLEYRRGWQDGSEVESPAAREFFGSHWHFKNDPHDPDTVEPDKKFLDFDEKHGVLKDFASLDKLLRSPTFKELADSFPWGISIKDLIDEHTSENPKNDFIKILRTSDQKDAAENRNNPLYSREQRGEKTWRSSPFGQETELACDQDAKRKALYAQLDNLLPEYLIALSKPEAFSSLLKETGELRNKILHSFKIAYAGGISDTCRPANDISLWDHAYGTACLFKALVAYVALKFNLSDPSLPTDERFKRAVKEFGTKEFDQARFALLGFAWDGLSYIEKGEKIGDSVGRARQLDQLKERLRSLVEVRYCLGNYIYEDENGVYFLIPHLESILETVTDPPAQLEKLVQKAGSQAREVTNGELPVHTKVIATTEYLNGIVALIYGLRKAWSVPWTYVQAANAFEGWDKGEGLEVCPVCRLRPTPDRQTSVCLKCQQIRRTAREPHSRLSPEGTVYIGEIVGAQSKNTSQKAALVVGRFELREWLNGRMYSSVFVKEGKTLEQEVLRIPEMCGFKTRSGFEDLKKLAGNIQEVMAEFKKERSRDRIDHSFIDIAIQCLAGASSCTLGDPAVEAIRELFFPHNTPDRIRRLQGFLGTLGKVYGADIELTNFLCTQNHTPSRLFAIWNETKSFFSDIIADLPAFLEEKGFEAEKRARLIFEDWSDIRRRLEDEKLSGVIELTFEGGECIEAIRADSDILLVNHPFNPQMAKRYAGRKVERVEGEFNKGEGGKRVQVDWTIERIEESGERYFPYRALLASPVVFMAIVPGSVALDLAQKTSAEYNKRFSKVKGRLPFSLGLVFFQEHTPMFAVLDAAKRMVRNFERLHTSEPIAFRVKHSAADLTSSMFRLNQLAELTAEFPSECIPDVRDDPHYPYIRIKLQEELGAEASSPDSRPEERVSFFPTIAGKVIHTAEVKPGDQILARPNYFDTLFLDSTARRFDTQTTPEEPKRLRSSGVRSVFPCFLDELDDILSLWHCVERSGIANAGLRGMESLLSSKLAEWQGIDGHPGLQQDEVWHSLVHSAVARSFAKVEHRTAVETAVRNGLFFDVMELFLRVLKSALRERGRK